MTIGMIWAQDRNGLLGTGTGMAWRVPADFAHFKRTTMGSPVIMGRASWEALSDAAPLPGRKNIVVTRRAMFHAPGAEVAHSLEEAIMLARWSSHHIWIAGGGEVYAEAMGIADELVVSDLDIEIEHSGRAVYAPTISPSQWQIDPERSDTDWREKSGDARWKVTTYVRSTHER